MTTVTSGRWTSLPGARENAMGTNPSDTTNRRERNVQEDEQRRSRRAKRQPQKEQDQPERQRYDQRQSIARFEVVVKLPA